EHSLHPVMTLNGRLRPVFARRAFRRFESRPFALVHHGKGALFARRWVQQTLHAMRPPRQAEEPATKRGP
ncbi:MAG: hypothetical protein ACOCVK_01610, partial [bacterium]